MSESVAVCGVAFGKSRVAGRRELERGRFIKEEKKKRE